MAINYNPRTVTDGLVLALDAGNIKAYDKYENLINNSSSTAAWVVGTFTTENTYSILGLNTVRVTNLSADGDSPYLSAALITIPGMYTVSHFIDTVNSTCTSLILYIFGSTVNGNSYASSTFTLSTKTFDTVTYSGTSWSNGSTNVEDYGNGIYRISITAQISLASTATRAYVVPSPANTSYALIAGSQYERGSSATDYYATSGTAKIRGTVWTDLSNNDNTGTLTNGPTYSSENGGCIIFDGTNDEVTFSSTSLNLFPVSFSFWATPGGEVINKYVASSLNGYRVAFTTGGVSAYYFSSGSNYTNNYDTFYGSASAGIFYHVVVTVDNSGIKFYINSQLVGSNVWVGVPGVVNRSPTKL